jgi:hypothetical protein
MKSKSRVKIECSQQGCLKAFKANLHEVEHGDGVKQYFQCPHCKTIYNVCKITAAGLEIRKQLQEVAKGKDTSLVAKLQAKLKAEVIRL